jgi:cell division protein FtsI/penicillin-binding protein 2
MPTLALLAASAWISQASTVVLRVKDGAVVRRTGPVVRGVHPGSALKPFTLVALLRQPGFDPARRVACPGRLTIAGRRLDCTHGSAVPAVNAAEALAFSCNHYFAHSAAGLRGLDATLREFGFDAREASSVDDLRQQAIGELGVQTDPVALARAYRLLALRSGDAALSPVFDGLRLAVTSGTAQLAGREFAGKTGTTSTASGLSLQAWFAGFTPVEHPEHVVVVFVPKGRGALDAAPLARGALRP